MGNIAQEEEKDFMMRVSQNKVKDESSRSALSSLSENQTPSFKAKRKNLNKILLTDPDLLQYNKLIERYHPKSLLQRYSKTQKKGSVKFDGENGENKHVCTVRFYTSSRAHKVRGEGDSPFKAEIDGCQKMLSQIIPNCPYWVDLVDYVDSLPIIKVTSILLFL